MHLSTPFMTRSVACCYVAVALACTHAPSAASIPATPPIEAAVELVVQRMVRQTSFDNAVEIPICIDERVRSVSAENLARRLTAFDPRIRPGAALNRVRSPEWKRGIIQVHIRSVANDDEGHLVIRAGYWCGLECADQSAYTLAVVDGRWSILYESFEWIS